MRARAIWVSITAVALAMALASCAHGPAVSWARGPTVVIASPGGADRADVRVEIANTSAEREVGLMYRKHLDADAGMLFVFAAPRPVSFWMKNTEIPLDMVFADSEARVIGIIQNAEPYSERALSVKGASEYVLEVNGGFCRRHGIKAGDRLKFVGFRPFAIE